MKVWTWRRLNLSKLLICESENHSDSLQLFFLESLSFSELALHNVIQISSTDQFFGVHRSW